MDRNLDHIAKPGDDDLDCDLDGITLTAVVAEGAEIIIHFQGGFGSFCSTDGNITTFEPGSGTDVDGEIHLKLGDWPDSLVQNCVERLFRWRDTGMPLRMCCAPHKASTLIEDEDTWLPLPRNPFPEQS